LHDINGCGSREKETEETANMAGLDVGFFQPIDSGNYSLSDSENGKIEYLKVIRCMPRQEDWNTVLILTQLSKSGSIMRGAIIEHHKRRPVIVVGNSS
jgi:hypothetical protein